MKVILKIKFGMVIIIFIIMFYIIFIGKEVDGNNNHSIC